MPDQDRTNPPTGYSVDSFCVADKGGGYLPARFRGFAVVDPDGQFCGFYKALAARDTRLEAIAACWAHRDKIVADALAEIVAEIESESERVGKASEETSDQDLREAFAQRVVGLDEATEIIEMWIPAKEKTKDA